ncbi:hypothetical protein OH492_05135 [Vibrio chagasii]|nr:hypothetical protein [Vibrio chagasii]
MVHQNRDRQNYEDYAGLALETQFLPDSPNHPRVEAGQVVLSA